MSPGKTKKSGTCKKQSKVAVNNSQRETDQHTQSFDIGVNSEDGFSVSSVMDSTADRHNLMNPRVKLTPLRNGDCNLPSPEAKNDEAVNGSGSSALRKRSRNVQLSSLFDSLTQFFSTTNERRRRTPFVSSFASDVSATAWWNSSRKATASRSTSSQHDDEKETSQHATDSDESRALPCKTDLRKPVTHAASRRNSSAGASSCGQAVNERRNSTPTDTEKDEVKPTVTAKNSAEKRPRNQTSVEHRRTDVRRLNSCSVDSLVSAAETAKLPVKAEQSGQPQHLKVESSRLQESIEAKRKNLILFLLI
jgi:hypothetical protein